jgi:hypothetical protein
MCDRLFWNWVVGGPPLELALIRQAREWLRDAIRAGTIVFLRQLSASHAQIIGRGESDRASDRRLRRAHA